MVRHKVAELLTRPDLARFGPTTPTRARRPLRASVDPTEARCEVASGPKTVESPYMLTNLLRC
jgi:hypothetical protein